MGNILMANIIPRLSDEQIGDISSSAEQKLYKALAKQLPNDYLIVHSLEFIKKTSKINSHGDSEADFVIFSPSLGILVVEVKGGGIKYDKSIGQWYSIDRQSNTHEIKNPVRQARDAKYEIRNHLQQKMGKKNLLLGHAVMFPDIEHAAPLVTPEMVIQIIGTNRNLSNLNDWVTSVFEFWSGETPYYEKLGEQGIKAAEQIYGKQVTIRPSLRSIIEKEIEKQIELTNQQKSILRQLKRRKEALIEGGAGTGKTVLALDQAISLSEQGLKVLLLCYNQKLGDSLKIKTEYFESLHSMSFHEFCSWRVRQANKNTGRDLIEESKMAYPKADFYDVIMPSALIDSYEIAPIEYDVILVDEGQDFKAEYWLAIELLINQKADTKLYIFRDCNQAIYSDETELPISCEPLYLFDNCRNTRFIHEAAYQYYKGADVEAPKLEGEETQLISKSTIEQQASEIDKLVSKLVSTENINPNDIVVITIGSYSQAQDLLSKSRNKHLWAFKEFSPNSKILVETSKRFKGLESKILILWIIDEHDADEKMLYVSISRARLRLWIVGNQTFIDRFNG
jgi:hypothetical protein